MDLRLGVLDQSPIPEGAAPGVALRNSIELARAAERLGYTRYWVAEHHGAPGLACASPEVLIGPIAAATSAIRVGSGGVMLPHYSPLKVAESFSMLSGLYPGRIDLGVGRAAGTSPRIALALQRDRRQAAPDDFPEQLRELLVYLGRHAPASDALPLAGVRGVLAEGGAAEPWLLGSSSQSAVWAAELGLPYVFADFIHPRNGSAAAYYREHFKPSPWLEKPRVGVAAWVICADTSAEAMRLSYSLRMMSLLLFRGRPIAVPPVERAERFLATEQGPPESLPEGRRIITGSPGECRDALAALAREYQADEVMVINIVHEHAARLRSYELLVS